MIPSRSRVHDLNKPRDTFCLHHQGYIVKHLSALFLALVFVGCAVDEDVTQVEQDVVTAEALSAAQFANAKTAASAIGGASLNSDSAAIQALVATADGQVMFGTIVACAVSSGQSVSATGPSGTLVFNGELGVAAAWRTSAPTSANKRWTTACVMARTNATGLTSNVSVRHDTYLPLTSTAPERATYTVAVGAFYGDLFQVSPKTFACGAVSWPPGSDPLVECARTINGVTTNCGFSWTGLCTNKPPCTDKTAPFGTCTGSSISYAEVATLFIP